MYPKENEWLFHEILSNNGCIISEYAPHIPPDTKKFPKRNRIISGISQAVLVVEAQYRSGSSITANYAKEQGKKVYAIPSNIDVSTGIGTNHLIRNGASLVTKPSQIQKELFQLPPQDLKKESFNQEEILVDNKIFTKENSNKNKRKEISEKNEIFTKEDSNKDNRKEILANNKIFIKENGNQDKVSFSEQIPKEYKEIYTLLENGPMHINEIAKKQQKSISELNGLMTIMEIEGYIKLDSNRYQRKE